MSLLLDAKRCEPTGLTYANGRFAMTMPNSNDVIRLDGMRRLGRATVQQQNPRRKAVEQLNDAGKANI